MNDVLTLVNLPTIRTGEVEETETEVFCDIRSVGMRETYAAAAVGVKPELQVRLADYLDYTGQPFARVDGKLFKVYRTYRDDTELDITLTAPNGLDDTLEICYLGENRERAWCAFAYLQYAEVDDAGITGLIRELHLIVNAAAYNGESTVEFRGKTYAVRRTFQEDKDLVDLYVEERAGV